ncbi:hypothetical protein [Pseudofulvibacter geojedonensis]|uniref:Uncharacterized protein n=1 Tax=Pseudofulvibacter geojedonensis TaxID=1123758 RepID=A0ABW3I351_9FLAO
MYVNIQNKPINLDSKQLENILAYKNENILSRFTDMYNVSNNEAEDIFKATLKFMYIAQIKGVFIPDELLIIDEMWHNFILFTKDYHSFCDKYFGSYFHHLPASKREKEIQTRKNQENPEQASVEFQNKLEFIMGVVYDYLGQETLEIWFRDYAHKYSREKILALRKS